MCNVRNQSGKKNVLISDKGRGDDPGGMQPCVAFHPCLYCLPYGTLTDIQVAAVR